jgi:hypothetical protein
MVRVRGGLTRRAFDGGVASTLPCYPSGTPHRQPEARKGPEIMHRESQEKGDRLLKNPKKPHGR